MNDLFLYMVKVSIVTGVLYSFYSILLQQTTFHQLNRILLLFIIAFSIICPFLDLSFTGSYTLNTNYLWINELDNFSNGEPLQKSIVNSERLFQTKHFVLLVYLIGVLLFLLKSIRQFRAIFYLKTSAVKILKEDSTVFVYLENIRNPFSFFKWIFLPIECHKYQGNASIIEHEKVHVKQLHSLDLILSEAYCIIFWFNPFVFLLQKSLKSIHEFIADSQVVRSNKTTIDQYLKLLVSVTEMKAYHGMTSSFKCLTIKKRIEMITNKKSSKKSSILYLLLVPVIALMLQSFSSVNESNDIPSLRPVKGGEISVRFGYSGINPVTKKQYTHGGIDIKISEGSSVISTASGEVIEASEKEGWGKLVVIKHSDGYETWYAHLSKINVKEGDKIKEEHEIGLSGNTGQSTAPHLHYEVRKNGERVNPEEYFD
jgi:beta-lactamase regulating signal transducer with metallopeptidase domain